MDPVNTFNAYRQKMNDQVLSSNNKIINRIFNLDTNAFVEGALQKKTKEILGLACSMVLRYDDCIKYHLGICHEMGLSDEEMFEVFAIANLIGGTVVIPHLRKATEYWQDLKKHV